MMGGRPAWWRHYTGAWSVVSGPLSVVQARSLQRTTDNGQLTPNEHGSHRLSRVREEHDRAETGRSSVAEIRGHRPDGDPEGGEIDQGDFRAGRRAALPRAGDTSGAGRGEPSGARDRAGRRGAAGGREPAGDQGGGTSRHLSQMR